MDRNGEVKMLPGIKNIARFSENIVLTHQAILKSYFTLYLLGRFAKLQPCLPVYLRWIHRSTIFLISGFHTKNHRPVASLDLGMLIYIVDLEDTDEASGLVLRQSLIARC